MIVVDVLYSTSAIGTQILLSNKGEHFLVDMGDGTVRDLVSKKTDFGKIRAVLLTHEHFDHFSGLYGFLHFCRLLRRKEELVIIAPRPIEVVGSLLKPPIMYQSLPFEVRLVELGDNETFSLYGLDVTAFSVEHGSGKALGYSIQDSDGYRVVVSGDTTACGNLARNVAGSDVAVIEATYNDTYEEFAIKYGHMTISQAEKLGKTAKKALYIHTSPGYYFKKFECSQK